MNYTKENIDYNTLPDGANLLFENDKPVAVVMNIKYYAYIQALLSKVKEAIDAASKNKTGDTK